MANRLLSVFANMQGGGEGIFGRGPTGFWLFGTGAILKYFGIIFEFENCFVRWPRRWKGARTACRCSPSRRSPPTSATAGATSRNAASAAKCTTSISCKNMRKNSTKLRNVPTASSPSPPTICPPMRRAALKSPSFANTVSCKSQ